MGCGFGFVLGDGFLVFLSGFSFIVCFGCVFGAVKIGACFFFYGSDLAVTFISVSLLCWEGAEREKGRRGAEKEKIAYHVARSIIYSSQRISRIVIYRAQISLLFFLAANFLRNGCVADAFDNAADDWNGARDVFGR